MNDWQNDSQLDKSTRIRVVESENDFPISKVRRIVVGSAHAEVRDPEAIEFIRLLLAKLVSGCFSPSEAPEVVIENKTKHEREIHDS